MVHRWCVALFPLRSTSLYVSDNRVVPDYLAASHHGKGIMSAAIGTLIRDWAVPRMGVRQIRIETFVDNIASRRVFEKNGFMYEKTVPMNRVTNSGRLITGMDILWWRAE